MTTLFILVMICIRVLGFAKVWIVHMLKASIFHDSYFVYIVETFVTLNQESSYKYISPFSTLPLQTIHLFFSIDC